MKVCKNVTTEICIFMTEESSFDADKTLLVDDSICIQSIFHSQYPFIINK